MIEQRDAAQVDDVDIHDRAFVADPFGAFERLRLPSVSFGDVNVMRAYESSNINPSVQQAIMSAWVVIETGATFGKSLTQIADYAAMRGLAMVRPAELASSEDTILALFEPGSPAEPARLTEFDQAYLKSLYRVQGRRWARQQVRQMADAITREAEQHTP